MEIIADEDFEQQVGSYLQREIIYNTNGFDRIDIGLNRFYKNNCRGVKFSSGISLGVCDELYHNSLGFKCQYHDSSDLISTFYLSGTKGVISPIYQGCKENYLEVPGNHYLFFPSDIQELEQNFAGEHYHLVTIAIDLEIFNRFVTDLECLPRPLQLLLENSLIQPFNVTVGGITPEMQIILWQIINAPYQGILQQMYLESKAMELIVLQLAQIKAREQGKQRATNLKKDDIEKIYQAKEVLISNCEEPPTLINLAQQVGIHHMKLKQGFRELFGTTVFGYLHNYRMEMARSLLQEGNLNVTAIANIVGYSHLGHFSAAFKRKFGINPNEYKLGKK
ncbi:transcriptional regulator [Rivularia sp. IAM M-261]|nr:transcriptional regulator [Rivularia sp. IAM M-261]